MSDSLRGQFLIAGPRLRDPNFFKTAVLIIEHGCEGAMGLIVNRPSAVTVAQALNGHLELPASDDLVFVGGPVEPAALFVVHDCRDLDPSESPIVPGVFMGSNEEVFKSLVCGCESTGDEVKYRVYCGCAGWGPGQLEEELSRGDWLTVPADPGFVFHQAPYEVWDRLVSSCSRLKRIYGIECEHPEWN